MMKKTILALGLSGLLIASCGTEQNDQAAASGTSVFVTMTEPVTLDGTPVNLAGITFTPPTTWTDNGAGGMRKADYSLPAIEGESAPASVTVFYFGPTQGGGVADNLERWAGQIGASTDSAAANPALTTDLTVDGMTVATVEAIGVYKTDMGGDQAAQEGFRLTGAVIGGPEGNVFFKLTGPDQTAAAMNQGFVAMIKAITKTAASTY